jgi:hypothetical protein
MAEGNGIIDSEVAAMLLGISKNNLRQLVYRKLLTPIGKSSRRNTFRLQEVLEFQTRRRLGKTTE